MPNITTNHAITYTNTTAAKIFQPCCIRCTAVTGACDVLLTRSSGGPSSASSDDCSSPILLQESRKKNIIKCILNPCFQNIVPWVPVFWFFFFSAIECSSESFRVTCRRMQPESGHEKSLTPSVAIWKVTKREEKAIPKCTLNKAKHPT